MTPKSLFLATCVPWFLAQMRKPPLRILSGLEQKDGQVVSWMLVLTKSSEIEYYI